MARIASFGTPSFAVPCLRALQQAAGHEIVVVIPALRLTQARGATPS